MSRGFDFVVKAEKVVIKEKGDNNYKVKLDGVGDFLKYQVWSSTNANNINGDRSVFLLHAKDWVEQFKIVNSNRSIQSYTPTTVVEIDNKKYVTVITNAEFKNKKVIFHMSTDDVKFNSKKMKKMNKLPKGEVLNVRFDIDDIVYNSYCNDGCTNVFLPFLPPGVNINCVNICNGYDSCMTELSTQSQQPEVSFSSFCSDTTGVNSINNNTSSSDQFNAILQEAISVTSCSMM